MEEQDLKRVAHNYLTIANGGNYNENDINILSGVLDYYSKIKELKKYKVALLFICLNTEYWQYAKDAMEGAKKYFLPGHDVDMFLWSDMPLSEENKDITYGAKEVFPTEPIEWPYPTLFRYNLFLQQEEKLKDYDYIFYCDIDMKWVNYVGDEIFGPDITAAQHPMYALRESFYAPFEPNKESTAYVPQIKYYYAGGFQGGTAEAYLKAAKTIQKNIDADIAKINYTARWNEESHWNKYLIDNPPSVILSPSFVYPDSLINEYYLKVWGKNYPPKIITITKAHSVSKEAGEDLRKQLATL